MPDAVIVGGGPAGLAAAIELRRLGAAVTVVERELDAGGIPRHSDHTGFGLRDLRRAMPGPAYARRYRERAVAAGAELVTETMVTGWEGSGTLWLTGPSGRRSVQPGAIVLATGCRERPRSARLVPGGRSPGVMTTSTLQQLVHLKGRRNLGRRALIVGAEHVSFSAVATLAEAGASTVALVTELPRPQSLAAFRAGALVRYRAPVWTASRVATIRTEEGRVLGAEVEDLGSGRVRSVDCDLVVFTADWVPDHELAVMAGCELDRGTLGPPVDGAMRTSVPGLFAAGNLVHPAETADVCALDGRHAAAAVARHLDGSGEWPAEPVRVAPAPPLRWVAPGFVAPGAPPPRDRFLLRSAEFRRAPRLRALQGDRELWSGRVPRLIPGRSAHIPASWSAGVDPAGPAVRVEVA